MFEFGMALDDLAFAMSGGFLPTWGMKLSTGVSMLTPAGGRGRPDRELEPEPGEIGSAWGEP